MTVHIFSADKLWADALNISLATFGELDNVCHSVFDDKTEAKLRRLKRHTILAIDSGIPGLDYVSFVTWLAEHSIAKIIVFTDSRSDKLQHTQLMQQGCHAVIKKSLGFEAFFSAINSFREQEKYFSLNPESPFKSLNEKEKTLVRELLVYEIKELREMHGITQQAINKKKQKILKKLKLKTENSDLSLALLAKLHGFS